MTKKIFVYLLASLFFSIHSENPLLFSEFSSEGKLEYETKRTLCFFAFQNSSDSSFELPYLEKGLAEVIFSNLKDFHFIHDKNPLVAVQIYPFHSSTSKTNLRKSLLLEKKLLVEKKVSQAEAMLEGSKENCTYVLTGEYESISKEKLKIKIYITNRIDGKTSVLQKETSIRRAFQELEEISLDIKKILSPSGLAKLEITSQEEGGIVLIDDVYYGTLPFKKEDLTPDKHKITIEKSNYETLNFYITLEENSSKNLKINLKKLPEETGYLSITSNPQGAEVYFGNQFLGITPIEKAKVKVGENRVRVSLENHIDEFYPVTIQKEKTISLNVQLKEGNTKEYYKNRLYIFQDYTYFDFSLYSLYGSLIFYTSYMYSTYKISKDEDRLYAITTWNELNTLTQIQNLNSNSQSSFLAGLLYQQIQINQTEKNIQNYRTLQNLSIAGALGMLVSSFWFYNLGISSEAIEFGYIPKTNFSSQEVYFSIRFKWD